MAQIEYARRFAELTSATIEGNTEGMLLVITDEYDRFCVGDPKYDFSYTGYWTISGSEASLILRYLEKPIDLLRYENSRDIMRLSLRAEKAYYLDAPGESRDYVSVQRYEDGSVDFNIGSKYIYHFLPDQITTFRGALEEHFGL